MAARRVVVAAAVAQAVTELNSNEADSDEHLNEVLTHLTDCCQSSSSVTNIVQELPASLEVVPPSGTLQKPLCLRIHLLSFINTFVWDANVLR